MSEDYAPLLKGFKSDGLAATICKYSASFFTVTWQTVCLLSKWACRPTSFTRQQDRTHLNKEKIVQGITHEHINVNGIKIHAASLGREPDKPLMLFLHGFPEFWYSWRDQLAEFRNEYDAVAIDMRGYGQSDKPAGVASYTLDILASDVAGVVHALGHTHCVLVAHDWGAVVAWVVAGMYPQVVDRLVCLGGPHLGLASVNSSWKQKAMSWYILFFQWPFLPELSLRNNDYELLGALFTHGSFMGPVTEGAFTKRDIEWYKWAFSRPGVATASINYYRALVPCLTWAPIPSVFAALKRRLRMPVLSIMARKDAALTPELMDRLEEVAEVSEAHVVEGCSHWIQSDRPEEVARLMRAFLDAHPPTTRP